MGRKSGTRIPFDFASMPAFVPFRDCPDTEKNDRSVNIARRPQNIR
jgi:hypothetical protein